MSNSHFYYFVHKSLLPAEYVHFFLVGCTQIASAGSLCTIFSISTYILRLYQRFMYNLFHSRVHTSLISTIHVQSFQSLRTYFAHISDLCTISFIPAYILRLYQRFMYILPVKTDKTSTCQPNSPSRPAKTSKKSPAHQRRGPHYSNLILCSWLSTVATELTCIYCSTLACPVS